MFLSACIPQLSFSAVVCLSRSCNSRSVGKNLAAALQRRSLASFACGGDANDDAAALQRRSLASFACGGDAKDDDDLCHLAERYKYQSLPSDEHASFAFAQLARPGHNSIDKDEFISTLKRMQLDFNLGDCELRRVFDYLDENNDGRLSLEEFKSGRGSHPLTRTLVERLSSTSDAISDLDHQFPDPQFDCTVSTAEFYSAPMDSGFVGENAMIRKSLDYTYHNNYTEQRQHFQDFLIRTNVLLHGSGSNQPWYVLTCGPMGVGKGFVLGWMSAIGILQLESVSKIDPDMFKMRLPEWQSYVQNGMSSVAGSMTHAESSYIAEIAQHVAMNNSMDVWVDGSLRNSAWYETELQRIRKKFPQYRIAIISISAPEQMIADNIKRRAIETGRDVPEELQKASSLDEIGKGVQRLTHLVDLVASVVNTPVSETTRDAKPLLRYVSMVDRSGNWDLIRELASH